MTNNPLVSCVIPSYKRADTLIRAIESVLKQTYSNIEILVVDDNISGDEYSEKLKKIIKGFEYDSRVKLITQIKHINGAAARNAGIKAAKGIYISFLDDDDAFLPTKIETQVAFLESNSNYGGCSCLANIYKGDSLVSSGFYNGKEVSLFNILKRNVRISNSTFLCKKEVLMRFGGFDENLRRGQDIQLLADFVNYAPVYIIREHLVNMYADSEINRPTVNNHITLINDLFKSQDHNLQKLSKTEQKRVKAAYYFELAYVAIKSKKYFLAIKYLSKIGISIDAYRDMFKRYKERKIK